MNQITDELLRRRRTLFLAKRRKFINRTRLGKSGGGPSTQLTKAAAQASPTNVGTVNFTLTFPGPVTGLTSADIQTTGSTVGGTLVPTLSGGPTTYNISIAGATGNGNINCLVPVGAAADALGNPTPASNVASVILDTTRPSVTINPAVGQPDPAGFQPITYTVTFSEPVSGFLASDVVITGTAGGTKITSLSGIGPSYRIEVTGMTTAGSVIATIPANAAADSAGNLTLASNSSTVNWLPDIIAPTVTINKDAAQADPTSGSPVLFTVVFSEPVSGFAASDISFTGSTAGTLSATVSGSGPTYTVSVTGMTTTGNVVASIPAGSVTDLSGNVNTASTSTDNSVAWQLADVIAPDVTINQAAGQADPTSTSPILFTAVFSEPVTGFATGDVTIAGTAGGTKTATVSGTGPTYTVSVTGMTTSGTVVASIAAGVAVDLSGNSNNASTSTDNIVTWTAAAVGLKAPLGMGLFLN